MVHLFYFDFHHISKLRRNFYSFIHIHTNTLDWFGFDLLKWIRQFNSLKIRNIYSWFNHFNIILERVTERGYLKLSPNKVEVIDVRLGRSIHHFIHINITFHYQWTVIIISTIKSIITKFDGFQMWKIYSLFIQIIQILDITVDKEWRNTLLPNVIECKLGRSIYVQYHHLLYLL